MAVNSTPLASQFAVGVAVPRRFHHLRTNSITTKPHGTKITAAGANPALIKHEASTFGSKPNSVHTDHTTKRDKFVTYAFPTTIKVDIPEHDGVPEYTQVACTIHDTCKKAKVIWMNFWDGADHISATPPYEDYTECKTHELHGSTHEFYHSADTTNEVKGSVGCVSYHIGEDLQWVVAWRNSTNERNKVYTKIISGCEKYANVSKIKEALYKSTDNSWFDDHHTYQATAYIDLNSPKPTVTATLIHKAGGAVDDSGDSM